MGNGLKIGLTIVVILAAVLLVYFLTKGSSKLATSSASADSADIVKIITANSLAPYAYPADQAAWGDFAAWVKQDNGGGDASGPGVDFYNQNNNKILAFFKGWNIKPTGWNYHLLKNYANRYALSPKAAQESAVVVGSFKTSYAI